MQLNIQNDNTKSFSGIITFELKDKKGSVVSSKRVKSSLQKEGNKTFKTSLTVDSPELWSPESPYLYKLYTTITSSKGELIDSYYTRVGIRSVEMRGLEGFFLNGKSYGRPLIGANRHQDFAVIGNALPNSLHYRDAKKLRSAGLEIIRNAHYPQDPAFMDACDELGLFVIVNTPGWQFWNNAPIFEQRVYSDIRSMIRRDRNHTAVLLWEPILNETHYPDHFARKVNDITYQEYPFKGCYTASDAQAKGSEVFPIIFSHPIEGLKEYAVSAYDPLKSYYTREWGDNVDNWSSHNSTSRVSLAWGEAAQIVQSHHYAHPSYPHTSFESLHAAYPRVFGGTLWHSFDHQRGYHPDPFYGGIMDVFRQPKYSYQMFKSQRSPILNPNIKAESGPMIYIANELTPFSPKDIDVYTNCDEVQLIRYGGKDTLTHTRPERKANEMRSRIVTFDNAFNIMQDKQMNRSGKEGNSYFEAQGLIGGKVVATHKIYPSRRPSKLVLTVDNESTNLTADGADIVTIVASITDERGEIKHLNNYFVKFEIEGEGRLLANSATMTNPRAMVWGSAPILVQSSLKAGKIKVRASVIFEGKHIPISGEIELESIAPKFDMIYMQSEADAIDANIDATKTIDNSSDNLKRENEQLRNELNALKLKEVEAQQDFFGEGEK